MHDGSLAPGEPQPHSPEPHGEGSRPAMPEAAAPPSNIEAEQALLGAILINNEVYDRVSGLLQPEHFYDPVHARIYETAARRIQKNFQANAVTLKTFLEDDEGLKELGGAEYLARLAGAAVSIYSAKDYSQAIYDLAIRRELMRIGVEIRDRAQRADVDLEPTEQIVQAEQQLYGLAEKGRSDGGFVSFLKAATDAIEVANAAYQRDGGLAGISTGLIDLDKRLGGLHPSDLLILAGRPSMGKTSLATNIASEKIRRGDMEEEEFRRFVEAARELEKMPFYIDDTASIPIATLAARARRLKRTHGLDALVIDYLQLIRGSGRTEGRVNEIAEISMGLKAIAKELDIPVIALSQLSRQVESREDKRPQLSDLRESGSIEQDADVVMFVFREEYYKEREKPSEADVEATMRWQEVMESVRGKAELIIGKQRHGPIGTVELSFEGRFTRFGNLARSEGYAEHDGF